MRRKGEAKLRRRVKNEVEARRHTFIIALIA